MPQGAYQKFDALTNIIDKVRPHVVILTEAGLIVNHVFPWSHRLYQRHEWPCPDKASISYSQVILTREDVTVSSKVPISPVNPAAGRICGVDISFAGHTGTLRKVRVIGAYGPSSHREIRGTRQGLWTAIAELTRDVPNWIVGGDFNVSLNPWEHSRYNPAYASTFPALATPYRNFLLTATGVDTWDQENLVSAERDWTYLDHASGARRIIDRFAISRNLNCVKTRVIGQLIPSTQHRAVLADIDLDMRIPTAGSLDNRAPQRLIRPKTGTTDWTERMDRFKNGLLAAFPDTLNPPELRSDDEYDSLLRRCHDALTTAADQSFKRKRARPVNPSTSTASSPAHQVAARRYRAAGKLIYAQTKGALPSLLAGDPAAAEEMARIEELNPGEDISTAILRRHRKTLLAQVRTTKWNPNYVPSDDRVLAMQKTALNGGPIKHLFTPHHITKPPLVKNPPMPGLEDGEPTYAAIPADRLLAFTDYFKRLLTHSQPTPPSENKPWLTSQAAQRFRAALTNGPDPVVWPKPMTLNDLHGLLRKGNPRPSPGPDGWEKWTLRNAPDSFLKHVLTLANYTIVNDYFPSVLKANYISPLYKKGDITDPANYRGIVFANCLQSLVGTWATTLLQTSAWKYRLLPDTQIATQKGTQVGDLTAFLSQVHCLADSAGQTLYAIKGDHIKGFDNLAASAFPDVVSFFGLPESLVTFENARSAAVSLRVKSQDGIGEPFFTHGQTKQGDSASPIKYTLTMAMLHHWLLETLDPADVPVVRTPNGAAGTPHTAPDHISLRLLSVEAMDDSIFFGTSWDALRRIVALCDAFQTAYGILTAWDNPDKTTCFTFGRQVTTVQDFLDMEHANEGPPIDRGRIFQEFATAQGTHQVPVVNERVILWTSINDTVRMKAEIEAIIRDAPFPPGRDLPMALIRKAVWGMLLPKIRARLALQPIRPAEARDLDAVLARKIADCMRARHTGSNILSLPIHFHGFDFPSIYRINGELAVGSVLRSLNHKLPDLAKAAAMVHGHWMCGVKHCRDPLVRPRASQMPSGREDPQHIRNPATIPQAWHAAMVYLATAGMSLLSTDLTHLLTTDSYQHTSNVIAASGIYDRPLPATTNLGVSVDTGVKSFVDRLLTMERRPTAQGGAAHAHLVWYSNAPFRESLSPYDPSLLLPRTERREILYATIRNVTRPTLPMTNDPIWASDGSHRPSSGTGNTVSTTASVVGPLTAAFKLTGQLTTSAHGELVGLIAALHIAGKQRARDPKVVTDYLTAVKAVQTARAPGFANTSWAGRPLQGHYLWLAYTLRNFPRNLTVEHIAAHTDLQDSESKLNDAADRTAKAAHERQPGATVATLPPPTAFMPRYVPHHFDAGYLTDGWASFLDKQLILREFHSNPPAVNLRLTGTPARNPVPARDYFYTRSSAKLLPKVQYLARAGLLTTPYSQWMIGKRDSPGCPMCGATIGDDTHLFRDCQSLTTLRESAISDAVQRFWIPRERQTTDTPDRNRERLRPLFADYLRSTLDGDGGRLSYWNGSVPTPAAPLPGAVADQAHEFAIRLAALIYGRYIPHVSAPRDPAAPAEVPPTQRRTDPDPWPAPGEFEDLTDDASSEESDLDAPFDEDSFVYPGEDADDIEDWDTTDDPDPVGAAALFPVRPDLPPRQPLGVARFRDVPKAAGRKRTNNTTASGDDHLAPAAGTPADGDLGDD